VFEVVVVVLLVVVVVSWNEGRVEMVPSKQSTVAQTQHQTSVGYLLHLLKRLYHV
jgi:hypothetical protein